jgi:hypothetical protein
MISFSFRLVSDHSLIDSGVASVRRKLPEIVCKGVKLKADALAANERHDSRVHRIAPSPSPSLIHCSQVPRLL